MCRRQFTRVTGSLRCFRSSCRNGWSTRYGTWWLCRGGRCWSSLGLLCCVFFRNRLKGRLRISCFPLWGISWRGLVRRMRGRYGELWRRLMSVTTWSTTCRDKCIYWGRTRKYNYGDWRTNTKNSAYSTTPPAATPSPAADRACPRSNSQWARSECPLQPSIWRRTNRLRDAAPPTTSVATVSRLKLTPMTSIVYCRCAGVWTISEQVGRRVNYDIWSHLVKLVLIILFHLQLLIFPLLYKPLLSILVSKAFQHYFIASYLNQITKIKYSFLAAFYILYSL